MKTLSFLTAGLLIVGAGAVTAQQPTATPAPLTASKNSDFHFNYLYALDPAKGWKRTINGVRYRKISGTGRGKHPLVTDTVTVDYVGKFMDGTEFDSSVARGQPATFPLMGLIKGWQEAIPLMGVGDTYELAIPYYLAYGPQGRGEIPGGATLIFTIKLHAIAPVAAAAK